MTKRLIFNGFSMNAVSHVYHGLWRHPQTLQTKFNDLDTWVSLVKLLEKGKFDTFFVADILGVDAAYKGSWDTYVKEAVQIPINDSGVLVGALIQSSEHIGLTLTSSILQEHPFNFARKLSTLDHLSKGRVGWNIVTSVSHNAAQNFGFDRIVPHDERYRWAEEYVDVVYKLWEGSWDEDAVIDDKAGNIYADPAKIHRIHHHGQRYKVLGPHLSQPSPQRTPVLFQAGSSTAGRGFAARHAEGTFIAAVNPQGARRQIDETRALVRAAGRNADDLLFVQGMSFVVGGTEEEAAAKARDLAADISVDGLLAHISRDLGIDLGLLDPDRPVDELSIEGVQGIVRAFEEGNPGRRATVADLGRAYALSSQVVGTPETIADQLEIWQSAGIDGINLIYHTTPGSFVDFIENVTPVLQARGLAQTDYAEGTFREKLFAGRGARLLERHPAASYRGAFVGNLADRLPAA
ncbi:MULTISPECIES: LLM class flavin-dependent oxidoreductase [unclassified Aureimonas]|uniref:LLM class flavin-dependent oxidoreductase n=1 Tax=unclassified Aureimonas TaxID=2615206 RepID=UPI0006F6B42B|nr:MULTISPECIES: LLM class flavin-dependent oxidoreductase [unclassified Aureimonas]KQT61738.1 oxidoreductase [Aureimonas sp. Leaf460]KQT65695.1 oxidoreductase [Aureimonas sp. Leaf427]